MNKEQIIVELSKHFFVKQCPRNPEYLITLSDSLAYVEQYVPKNLVRIVRIEYTTRGYVECTFKIRKNHGDSNEHNNIVV